MKVEPRSSKCKADSFKTDLSQLCDDCPLRIDIPDGIERQIIAQAKDNAELLPESEFKEWLSKEMKSATEALDQMRILSVRPQEMDYIIKESGGKSEKVYITKDLGGISEMYIWNKERLKALKSFTGEQVQEKKKTGLGGCTHIERALYFYYLGQEGYYSLLDENTGNKSEAFRQITKQYGGKPHSFRNKYSEIESENDRYKKGNIERIEKILPYLQKYPKALQLAEKELLEIKKLNKWQ